MNPGGAHLARSDDRRRTIHQFSTLPPIGTSDNLQATDTAAGKTGFVTVIPLALERMMRVRRMTAVCGSPTASPLAVTWAMALYRLSGTPRITDPLEPLSVTQLPLLTLVQGSDRVYGQRHRSQAAGYAGIFRFNLTFQVEVELDPENAQFYAAVWTSNASGMWFCPPLPGAAPISALRTDGAIDTSSGTASFPAAARVMAAALAVPSITLYSTVGVYAFGDPAHDIGAGGSDGVLNPVSTPDDDTDLSLTDNKPATAGANPPAYRAHESTRDYIRIETTDGAERVVLGNSSTNPAVELAGTGPLRATDIAAGNTNTAGNDLSLAGGKSTGTGLGGSIPFRISLAGSTGSTQNALTTVAAIDGRSGALKQVATGVQPVAAAGAGFTHPKTSGGLTDLYYLRDDGTDIKLTAGPSGGGGPNRGIDITPSPESKKGTTFTHVWSGEVLAGTAATVYAYLGTDDGVATATIEIRRNSDASVIATITSVGNPAIVTASSVVFPASGMYEAHIKSSTATSAYICHGITISSLGVTA